MTGPLSDARSGATDARLRTALSCAAMPAPPRDRPSESRDDSHHFVSDGRRWRRTDPGIPDSLRAELVHELMGARRAVAEAQRARDDRALRLARGRVQDAKVALGERGPVWWESHSDEALHPRIEAAARALLRQRGSEKTICPSDVARVVGGAQWRKRMQAVRAALLELVQAGELEVRQKGKAIRPEQARGPIRIAMKAPIARARSATTALRSHAKRPRR